MPGRGHTIWMGTCNAESPLSDADGFAASPCLRVHRLGPRRDGWVPILELGHGRSHPPKSSRSGRGHSLVVVAMTAPAQPRIGGTASPSTDELLNAGRQIVDYFGRSMSTSRILRLAIQFKRRSPNGGRELYFLFVCAEIQVSELQKQRARQRAQCNPEWATVIGYSDHTGEDASWNADHPNCQPRGY